MKIKTKKHHRIQKNILRNSRHAKHLTKTKKMNRLRCSPKPSSVKNDYSCYTNNNLYKLKDLWNARHSDAKITTNSPKEIHHLLSKYLENVCNKESCWIKRQSDFGKIYNEMKNSFAPISPSEWEKNPNEWLSSIEIINVMKQYEKAYKCFEFIGPTPIDFDTKKMYGECVWDELCKLNIKNQIKSGKTKIGIIFNTDPHNKPGQHWISMFINIKTKQIFFFDSTGDKPPPQIMVLVDRIKSQGLQLHPKIAFNYDSNEGVEHQYGNTECGIYSLFFIVHMLEDKLTANYLKTHILKDAYMEKFRQVYFNRSL